MYAAQPPRTLSAALSLGIVGLIGFALVWGLGVRVPPAVSQALVSVALTSPPPPPPPVQIDPPRPKTKAPKAKDKPSPRNIKNQATQVVAPPIVHPLVPPPPIAVATQAGLGSAANNGASTERGPGQGAGGTGNGLGGGGNGGGDGDGVDESVIGPRQISGRLSYRDLPEDALPPGRRASVDIILKVARDGTVARCYIEHSSGNSIVDNTTCRLAQERFRFRPALNEDRQPVSALVAQNHQWMGYEER